MLGAVCVWGRHAFIGIHDHTVWASQFSHLLSQSVSHLLSQSATRSLSHSVCHSPSLTPYSPITHFACSSLTPAHLFA